MPLDSAKPRPRREMIMYLVQPAAGMLVRALARLGVAPLALVLAHGVIGLAAASLVASRPDAWLLAALLLQLKTLLDNVDGGLARATGRVTLMGRYLDTMVDLVVNLALFAALAGHGPPLAALGALLLLTLILSLDFNLEHLYKTLRRTEDAAAEQAVGAPLGLYRLVKGAYDALLWPQDRLFRRLDRALFERSSGLRMDHAPLDLRLAWNDMYSTASVVNLGLSTQYVILGACLALGHPFWYVLSLYLQALYVLGVTLLRILRFRAYLRAQAGHDPLGASRRRG